MKDPFNPWERARLIDVLRGMDCRSILEIGSRYGTTLATIARALPPKWTKLTSIDLPGGQWGSTKTMDVLTKCISDLGKEGYDAAVCFGDSRSEDSIAFARSRAPYGFVFIDGDHNYPVAYADWLTYGPMGRVVGFHDIAAVPKAGNPREVMGIPKLWAELKVKHKHIEIVAPTIADRMGIGLIYTSEKS